MRDASVRKAHHCNRGAECCRISRIEEPIDKIVCDCAGVTQSRVDASIAHGYTTIGAICRETGCGSVCGECLPRVQELLGGAGMVPAVARRIDVAHEISCFQLYPHEGRYHAPEAGQYLLVGGLIAGTWVSRCYTITSAAQLADHVEITVKHRPTGVFSSWLFDGPLEDKELRVSEPLGTNTWDTTAPATVCVVHGIGVTPAICILRTAIAQGRHAPLHIDYSFHFRNEAAFAGEIEQAAAEHSWITCRIRNESKESPLSSSELVELARAFPHAAYHVCGPIHFMDDAAAVLKRSSVPAKAIKLEEFYTDPSIAKAQVTHWGARRVGYAVAALIALSLVPVLTGSAGDSHLAIGPMTPGHEALSCTDCHQPAPGTMRQQLQANLSYLLGQRAQPVDFGHQPVTTAACASCHSMQDATHAPAMFLEPRYELVRDTLGPHECVNCHVEHDANRVSLSNTLFCMSCHETVSMKEDPLDVSHAELVKTGQWDTCMSCHDYHGNHYSGASTKLNDRFSLESVEEYFERGASPYGERKRMATPPKRANP